jgi:hypothetical protein
MTKTQFIHPPFPLVELEPKYEDNQHRRIEDLYFQITLRDLKLPMRTIFTQELLRPKLVIPLDSAHTRTLIYTLGSCLEAHAYNRMSCHLAFWMELAWNSLLEHFSALAFSPLYSPALDTPDTAWLALLLETSQSRSEITFGLGHSEHL